MVDSFYWAIIRFRLGSFRGLGTYTVPDPDPGNGALKEEKEENYNRGERSGLYASEERRIYMGELIPISLLCMRNLNVQT